MSSVKTDILLESGTNEVEFIEFFIAGISYGINVAKVQRVVAFRDVDVTKRLSGPPSVMGIIYNHNRPINLIDLRSALNLTGEEASDPTRQLVLITNFNRITTGYLIDGIQKIYRTSWENYKPLDESAMGTTEGYTTGTIEIEDRLVLILDLERLMLDFGAGDNSEAEAAKAASETEKDIIERRGMVKVVYAEDSSAVRHITTRMLNSAGYNQVEAFSNGKDALDYVNAQLEEARKQGCSLTDLIDVIVTDIEMPRMDGLTLCKNVKSADSKDKIPAVMVYSSLINEEMSAKCRRVGADAQMSKPHGDEIVAIIDKLCLGKEAPEPALA